MKILIPISLAVASIGFASGVLDVWTDKDQEAHQYVDTNWLGGTLQLSPVVTSEESTEQLQFRIKMTGAGSIPEGESEYFVTQVEQGSALPSISPLKKATADWKVLPGGNRGNLLIETGDRMQINGKVQGYTFSADADLIER